MRTKMLRVMPNCYSAHDHEGRPSGRLQYEPNLVGGDASLRYVGCTLVATKIHDADPKAGRPQLDEHCVHFATEPTSVEASAYYLKAIRSHQLFAADEATHEAVFGSRAGFIDPKERFAQYAAERDGVLPEPRDEWAKFLGVEPKAED